MCVVIRCLFGYDKYGGRRKLPSFYERKTWQKKKTSKRVSKIASSQLRNKKTGRKAKSTAGSALTQYEPTRRKRIKN